MVDRARSSFTVPRARITRQSISVILGFRCSVGTPLKPPFDMGDVTTSIHDKVETLYCHSQREFPTFCDLYTSTYLLLHSGMKPYPRGVNTLDVKTGREFLARFLYITSRSTEHTMGSSMLVQRPPTKHMARRRLTRKKSRCEPRHLNVYNSPG